MGLRFSKRVKLLPGLRMNLGLRGVSFSVGGRGKSITFGRRGTHVNLGIPGTGISYRQRIDGQRQPTGRRAGLTRHEWYLALVAIILYLIYAVSL